jgi:hypothetical protein
MELLILLGLLVLGLVFGRLLAGVRRDLQDLRTRVNDMRIQIGRYEKALRQRSEWDGS